LPGGQQSGHPAPDLVRSVLEKPPPSGGDKEHTERERGEDQNGLGTGEPLMATEGEGRDEEEQGKVDHVERVGNFREGGGDAGPPSGLGPWSEKSRHPEREGGGDHPVVSKPKVGFGQGE